MSCSERIKHYVLDEFLPGVGPEELEADYDLRANGVIDSLGLLRVITWLEAEFEIPMDEVELVEQDFTTLTSITRFVERHSAAGRSDVDSLGKAA
ncbi:acyl carrier protein [Amycolatopsis sp., V23-08]|uniref:Acyl carrier protein n=1 Tax=Amycolatopsis heterodermiae TaxID=3110235 RepID=A0ABU5RN23_9PSEU|nr:acyl carrier protein [Amycolatopsis sp., V23-08]MEA5366501.1 acyl carrier protein [Amycolatopsis sp., V23-08]